MSDRKRKEGVQSLASTKRKKNKKGNEPFYIFIHRKCILIHTFLYSNLLCSCPLVVKNSKHMFVHSRFPCQDRFFLTPFSFQISIACNGNANFVPGFVPAEGNNGQKPSEIKGFHGDKINCVWHFLIIWQFKKPPFYGHFPIFDKIQKYAFSYRTNVCFYKKMG